MKIELLYFEDCPHYATTLDLLNRVLKEENIKAGVEQVRVRSDQEAESLGFLGSPSVRINGKDIEENLEDREVGLKCRLYPGPGEPSGIPPEDMVRNALRKEA